MTDLVEFRMPDVGEGIAEAEVLEWFAEVGDTVEADQPLCQIETDKSVVEIPAPATGTVLERCVEAGSAAVVGELLVIIGDVGALSEATGRTSGARSADSNTSAPAIPSLVSANGSPGDMAANVSPGRRPMASPRTRRLAVQRGIDLAAIAGSGPHGRILEIDLDSPSASHRAVDESTGSAPTRTATVSRTDEVVELRGLRRSIARSMTEALKIPHITEFREVDATNLLEARAALKPSFEAQGIRLSVFPLLLKAVIRALAIQPSMNATYDADAETLTKPAGVHLGVATATDDGLIVPVIRDADLLSLTDLAQEVARLAERARTRTATRQELIGGSFTVSNFGSFGTWMGSPVIRPPEVAIAGFGRITERVIAVDGQALIRPVLPVVVAADHRINDGSHLAEFVTAVADAVIQPLLLLS